MLWNNHCETCGHIFLSGDEPPKYCPHCKDLKEAKEKEAKLQHTPECHYEFCTPGADKHNLVKRGHCEGTVVGEGSSEIRIIPLTESEDQALEERRTFVTKLYPAEPPKSSTKGPMGEVLKMWQPKEDESLRVRFLPPTKDKPYWVDRNEVRRLYRPDLLCGGLSPPVLAFAVPVLDKRDRIVKQLHLKAETMLKITAQVKKHIRREKHWYTRYFFRAVNFVRYYWTRK